MAKNSITAATKALQQELKSLQKEPLEGFTVQLVNDNLFEWEVAIFGNYNAIIYSMLKYSHLKSYRLIEFAWNIFFIYLIVYLKKVAFRACAPSTNYYFDHLFKCSYNIDVMILQGYSIRCTCV